jgi:YVTN family beta-propeller protein
MKLVSGAWVGRRGARLRAGCTSALVVIVAGCGLQFDHHAPDRDGPEVHAVSSQAEGLTTAQAALARWSSVVTLPVVPVSAANLPDGKLLLWSAEDRFSFGSDGGRTYTATFDPATSTATERLASETAHDMFCPGTATLPDGRILVNGGLSNGKTSLYDPSTGAWTRGGDMNITRAYEGTAPLADGSVLTLGGSWSGGVGNKHGEVWTEATGWRRLPGVTIDPFLSIDKTRNFGMDSHLWLLQAGNGRVFHAGPGFNMNWVDTDGNGRVTPAGRRGDDEFSINGNAVMFDIGRVLKVGGAAGYEGIPSNANSYVIELGATATVRKVQSMAYRRAFQNSVVLPNGQVVVIGGATVAVGFSDSYSVLAPEIFDPVTETFTALAPMSVPRNYHSIALLLADGRVVSAGGGLCGACAANHADLQILSPPYLFNADGTLAARPEILAAPTQASHGTRMTIATRGAVASFVLMRSSSTTHALNNDQRRLPLEFRATAADTYAVDVPSNPGWAVPGLYMLFALDANGVPSVAKTVRIGSVTPLWLASPGDQTTTSTATTRLVLGASGGTGGAAFTYGATGLPPGLGLDPATGVITGAATAEGRYPVEVSVSDGQQTVSTQLTWTVNEAGTTRFVRLEARTEVNGNPWTSAAEINLLDDGGQLLARGGWTVTADSEERVAENGAAANAIDGNPSTIWHTQYQGSTPPLPHWLTIDLGGPFRLGGLRYLPRQDAGPNGTVAQYRVLLSDDGVTWGNPVSEGDASTLGGAKDEKSIYFGNVALGKAATQSSTFGGALAARAVDGNPDSTFGGSSLSHTNSEANAWWEVDLGATYRTHAVRLRNRTDCCSDRLTNFYVLASATPMAGRSLEELLADPGVTSVPVGGTAPPVQLLMLATRARYVRVELTGTNYLTLAEVEVYGTPASNRRPTLVAPVPPDLPAGGAVTFALQASDPDGDALTYAATGLPPGLVLDASTGIIRGTAIEAGSYAVDVTIVDGEGGSATGHFNWFIGMQPPVVSPVVAPVAVNGTTVTYAASATGSGALEYSWSFGDGSTDSAFGGAPSVTHAFPRPGAYIVTLTVRNSEGGAVTRQFLQAVGGPRVPGSPVASSNVAFETRSGASPRLWVLNLDGDTVSVFDTQTNERLREIAVGTDPRSVAIGPDGRAWVTNKRSSTVSIIDPVSLRVVQTVSLPRASLPFGVIVGTDGTAYVALEATGRVLKIAATGVVVASLDVGPSPRHLALTASGDRLLVSRFITRFQPGEATAAPGTRVGDVEQGADVVVVDPSAMAVRRTVTLQHSDRPDTTVSGRGVPNYLGAPAISPDGLSAWIPSKQDDVQRGTLRDARNLDFQNTVRAITSRIDLEAGAEDYAARVDHDNSGMASAAAFDPSGVYLFVTLETSRQLAVLDAYGKRELFKVDTGRAPQGVVLAADGRTLYVHDFMDRTVGVYDLRPLLDRGEAALPRVATLSTVAVEKLSSQVLRGKQLFYDARDTRLARDGYLSCATCHDDGGHDGRTWDLTGMGEGLRNTISLRGRAGAMGRLHWSANFDEVQDFEGQIRALSQGTGLMTDAQLSSGTRSQTLGDPKAGLSADLDALAAYVASLTRFEPSPYRDAAGALTADATLGRTVFAAQCTSCHGGDAFSDSASLVLHDVGTLKPTSGSRLGGPLTGLDTPTLRDVWATAPYLHDGSAPTIEAAIQAHTSLRLSPADLANVAALTRQIGSEEPAIAPPLLPGTGLTGQYFANAALTGAAALTRTEAVNFAWGGAAPATGLPADNFSARWTGQVGAPSTGTYRFQTVSDDGVRLWVNGALVVDRWTDHGPTTDTASAIALVAGQRYDIKVEYYERGGGATMQLNWLPPASTSYAAIPASQLYATGPGLRGEYFGNAALTGAASLTRYEAVDFAWAAGSPGAGVPADNFSARWTGQVSAPSTGTYRFQTVSDDGVRLWVNGALVVDRWTDHSPTTDATAPIALVAGQRYDLKVEYYERGGGATMQLQWMPPGAASFVAVAAPQLYGN